MQYKLLGFSPTKFNGDNGSVEGLLIVYLIIKERKDKKKEDAV